MKFPVEFVLIMYRFVVNPLTYCATLWGDHTGRETIYKITLILLFISINSTSQHEGVPYHLKKMSNVEDDDYVLISEQVTLKNMYNVFTAMIDIDFYPLT